MATHKVIVLVSCHSASPQSSTLPPPQNLKPSNRFLKLALRILKHQLPPPYRLPGLVHPEIPHLAYSLSPRLTFRRYKLSYIPQDLE